jgi:hypothetical protein
MTDYHAFIHNLPSQLQHFLFDAQLVWVVPAVLLAASLWLLRPWFRRWRQAARMRACVAHLGKAVMRNVSLDNGMDGVAFMDWLVLTDRDILVVSMQRGHGIVFGADTIDSWARVVGRRTTRFPNPLAVNAERVAAVKFHEPGVAVRGIVLFEEGASFPKGQPEGVLLPSQITDQSGAWAVKAIPEPLQAAWEHLGELGARGEQAYGRDMQALRGGAGHGREIVALILLMLSLAVAIWGGWQLFYHPL